MENIIRMFEIITVLAFVTCFAETTTNDPTQSTASLNVNKNFIHHNARQHLHSKIHEHRDDFNRQIFINQSNNIHILAKHGQTVNLPCLIFKQKHHDLSNIYTIWNKLNEKQRPVVLSIGHQQLKQDMRYRIRLVDYNKNTKSQDEVEKSQKRYAILPGNGAELDSSFTSIPINLRHRYFIQNWQLEIRKINFDDAGTYQCLLPLVKPIVKNITLQVVPDLVIEPRQGNFRQDDKIVIKCRATLKYQPKMSHNLNQRQQKPNIHWYKENEIIKTTSSRSISSQPPKIQIDIQQDQDENLLNSILTINNAKIDDSGKYKCLYDNIQEQVDVKVIYDYYEYKNYISTGSNLKTNLATSLVSVIMFALWI